MSQAFGSPMWALAAAADSLGALFGSRAFRTGRGVVPASQPIGNTQLIRPPRVYTRRQMQSAGSRYMPHQGARERLRRRMGGFAGVPQSVQTGRETPESWYDRQFNLAEAR